MRSSYRHTSDQVIPKQEGYDLGKFIQVTPNKEEIEEELKVDPDFTKSNIEKIQESFCGKYGVITGISNYGWLLVMIDSNCYQYFTPYCLILQNFEEELRRSDFRLVDDEDGIPVQFGYEKGKLVMVTSNKKEIEEEFLNDSDMKGDATIKKAQEFCGQAGIIRGRTDYG